MARAALVNILVARRCRGCAVWAGAVLRASTVLWGSAVWVCGQGSPDNGDGIVEILRGTRKGPYRSDLHGAMLTVAVSRLRLVGISPAVLSGGTTLTRYVLGWAFRRFVGRANTWA